MDRAGKALGARTLCDDELSAVARSPHSGVEAAAAFCMGNSFKAGRVLQPISPGQEQRMSQRHARQKHVAQAAVASLGVLVAEEGR
jgi:hypothetical protein